MIPEKLAEVNLEALRDALAATIEEAKQQDPRELRRQIAGLERKLAEKPKDVPAQIVERIVERPMLKAEEVAKLEILSTDLRAMADVAEKAAETVDQSIAQAKALMASVTARARQIETVKIHKLRENPANRRDAATRLAAPAESAQK